MTARTTATLFAVLTILATPALADPPPLTGPDGPVVRGPIGPLSTLLLASERGLAIGLGDLADLTPAYVDGTGPHDIQVRVVFGTLYSTPVIPARYGADTGTDSTNIGPDSATTFSRSFGYRVSTDTVAHAVALDGGVEVAARIGNTGAILGTATAATLAEAVAAVRGLANVAAVLGDVVSESMVAAGSRSVIDTATTRLLTGRDTYVLTITRFGPVTDLVGNLGECAIPIIACAGGVVLTVDNADTQFNNITLQDLYITDTVRTTTTTTQLYWLNLFLAAARTAAHAGAQAVGFQTGDRFLDWLTWQGAGRSGAAKQDAQPAGPERPLVFAEISGTAGSFAVDGIASDWRAGSLRSGLSWGSAGGWTLGLAVEAGQWDWQGDGDRAEGDTLRFGGFASRQDGPWTLTATGFVGRQGIATTDALGATAAYDARAYGLGVEARYAVQAGDWQVSPLAGLRWLAWDTPEVTDSLGNRIDGGVTRQLRTEIGVIASRPLAGGTLGFEARLWDVTGNDMRATSGAAYSVADTKGVGGNLAARAQWQVAPGAVLTAAVGENFASGSRATTGEIGLRMSF